MSTDPRIWGRRDPRPGDGALPEVGQYLRVTDISRDARADLGPTAWAVLEDVALEARPTPNHRLVAATNVRRIAANLGISKDTAARALVRLADAGLVVRQVRHRSTSGAFAPSAYELHLSSEVGLALATAERGTTRRAVLDERAASVADSSGDARDSRRADDVAPRPRRRRRRASSSDQRALFDMGSETSERR